MNITDQQLSAYLDGELPDDQLAQVEQALVNQPELAQRLQQLAQVSPAVNQTYARIDQQPMPQTIMDMLKPIAEPTATATRTTATLADRWQTFLQSLRPLMPAAGLTAALALGLLIGSQTSFFSPSKPTMDSSLSASIIQPGDALFDVLENTSSATTQQLSDDLEAMPVLTFQTTTGQFCREFRTQTNTSETHAVACRETDAWHLQVVSYNAATGANENYYLTASGTDSPGINDFVRQHMQGDAIDASGEQSIIASGWHQ